MTRRDIVAEKRGNQFSPFSYEIDACDVAKSCLTRLMSIANPLNNALQSSGTVHVYEGPHENVMRLIFP